MKRLLAGVLLCALLLGGCGKDGESGAPDPANLPPEHGMSVSAPAEDYIEIGDRLFIAQTNDIYLNPENYFGKTIKYEGIFLSDDWGEGDLHHFVLRYGPGCCGYDGQAGFEVHWEGEMPEQNDWVEVTGQVEFYDYNGFDYLWFRVDDLVIKEERGTEYVTT